MARFTEKEKDLTVLGEKTKFNGVLQFTEDLHIAGAFSGTIDARGSLVIKKTAICSVDYIKAASIVLEGSVQGDLTAGDRVELKTGSSLRGNITTSRLRIADSVSFEGSVEMIRNNSEIDLFSTRTDVLKKQVGLAESE